MCLSICAKGIYTSRSIPTYENLHHSRMMTMKTIAAMGAYWRIIACMLMFRAALRYFSDSERNEVDRCDIPVKITAEVDDYRMHRRNRTYGQVNPLSTEALPCFWS